MASPIEKARKTVQIPLIGVDHARGTSLASNIDQEFDNCLFSVVKNPIVNGSPYYSVSKRGGFQTISAVSGAIELYAARSIPDDFLSAQGTAAIFRNSSNDILITINGTTVDTIACTATAAGSLITPFVFNADEKAIVFSFEDNSVNQRAFIYNITTDTTTEITDADFPDSTIIGNFVHKNGRLHIMTYDTGRIYSSDLGAPLSWEASRYISVQNLAEGCGLAKYKDKIVAFTTNTIEFFEDVGNDVGSPLRRIDALAINGYGVKQTFRDTAPLLIWEANNTVYWQNNESLETGGGIYMLDNYQPVRLSTPELDKEGAPTYVGTVPLNGHHLMVFNADGTKHRVYNIELNLWSTWTLATTFNTASIREFLVNYAGGTIAMACDTGFSIMSSGTPYTDQGNAFTWSIRTRKLDLGTERRKRLHKLSLLGIDTGSTTSPISVSWSDNDYSSFTTARTVDASTARTYLTNCGSFRRRAFKLEHTANTPVEFNTLELEYSELDS